MAEFLLLLNYIEVVIPQIFAIYLIVTYHLSNREYYSVFYNMNESQLYATLKNLLVYWFLQLLSLLGLDMLLRHMLGLSPVRVLAFVLEKQVESRRATTAAS
ncbi:ABCG transporter ABC Superfamily [Phytophthora cinnamomi]|uniref:ABCG transporter ABC Superfamily n=1 Tax=Phytophthora cinnamomi TaxID=4785 RepID=UPI0035598264|nr:ABCG transporter ABC Superfamily [Phytophthora cinnamomi]